MSNSVFGYLSDRLSNVVSQAIVATTTETGNMIVASAGTAAVNGIYLPAGTRNGKTIYTKNGTDTLSSAVYWAGSQWVITDAFEVAQYFSSNNVATPNLVNTWIVAFGTNPVPAVTAETTSTYVETRNGLTTDDITYPLVYCYAGEATEVMTPGCGVFMVPVTLTYAAKADDITADAYDENWQTLLRYLWDSSLPSTLTTTGFHVYGITYGPQSESIENDERVWARAATLEVRCMPRSNS
jgi:hypothetical protein